MSHRHADPIPTLLPLLAVKALLALAARDHSTARTLWTRSKGEHSHAHAPLAPHGRGEPSPGSLLAGYVG